MDMVVATGGQARANVSCISALPDGSSLKIYKGGDDNEHTFSFDKTFGPEARQEDVFTEVKEFVQSALDGHMVCLFSYGQTGSGTV